MELFRSAAGALVGFSAGMVVAGAVFAFIAIVGIVPRIAHKTGTQRYIKIYEEAIILGGIFGATTCMINYYIPVGSVIAGLYGLLYGVFVSSVAVCLAEVLNVLPILTRRTKLQKGLGFFITAFAVGKLGGSLIYFLVPGFFEIK